MNARLVRWLYTLLLVIVSPVLLWSLYRTRANKPEFGHRWREHFGFTPKLNLGDKHDVIWVHAVSVGEVLASKALIIALAKKYPEKLIVVTTTTSTGAEQAKDIAHGIEHRYMPIDFSWCVRGFISSIKPSLLLVVETEVWPNTLHEVAKSGIPIQLLNARLSDKSLKNYQKLRMLITPALANFRQINTVHANDSDRFLKLGVDLGKVNTVGSLKYDMTVSDDILLRGKQLREKQLGGKRTVFIAASTHSGEDEILLDAYKTAKKNNSQLLLLIVARHPERFDLVESLVEKNKLKFCRRTQLKVNETVDQDVDVYIADTMGEMMVLLAASDLVFMGGSLIGKKVGGHNFIEPALLSKPCLTGPSYYNFTDIAQQLLKVGGLQVVCDADDISHHLTMFYTTRGQYTRGAEAGRLIVSRNQGALDKTLKIISANM